MKSLEVLVNKDFLSYQSYPIQYPPLRELGCIRASEIELIFGEYRDFELLLRNGNVVFFPETKRIALQQFVRANGIPVVRGLDVWDLLTEPFLDTEFTEEQSRRTVDLLGGFGFSPEQVAAIRQKVRFLYATNFFGMEWDWDSPTYFGENGARRNSRAGHSPLPRRAIGWPSPMISARLRTITTGRAG